MTRMRASARRTSLRSHQFGNKISLLFYEAICNGLDEVRIMHMGRNGVVDEVHIMHMGFYLYINFILQFPEGSMPRHYLQRIVRRVIIMLVCYC